MAGGANERRLWALRAAEQHEQERSDYDGAMRVARDRRDQAVYDAWLQGARTAEIAHELGMSSSGVHDLLARWRRRQRAEGVDVDGLEHEHGRGSRAARRYRREWW